MEIDARLRKSSGPRSVGSCGTLYSGNIYDSRDIDHRNDSPAEAQKKLLPINTASPRRTVQPALGVGGHAQGLRVLRQGQRLAARRGYCYVICSFLCDHVFFYDFPAAEDERRPPGRYSNAALKL